MREFALGPNSNQRVETTVYRPSDQIPLPRAVSGGLLTGGFRN